MLRLVVSRTGDARGSGRGAASNVARMVRRRYRGPMDQITWNDFMKVDLRVGRVVSAEAFPEARKPAYKLKVDFGPDVGVLKSSAQITDHYEAEALVGRLVVGVVNFPPKQIGPMRSECLVTGFHDSENAVVLCVPDADVAPGTRLL